MKTLDEVTIKRIKDNYQQNLIDAMLDQDKVKEVLSFMERNKDVELTYEQVFFSPSGFDVYELNGERRIFCVKNNIFPLVPLMEKDATGDWKEWLKKAKKIKEIR